MTLAFSFDDADDAAPTKALTDIMDRLGVRMSFAKDEEIYAQEDEAEMIYRVVSGVVRTTCLLSDGRRQVGAFYSPGQLFGVEPGPEHRFGAEGLTDCVVQVVKRSALRAHGAEHELDEAILAATFGELRRAQDHLLLLGRKSACERVASFLMARAEDHESEDVDLPMGRQDMADYLGLTIETVSRMLTQLQSAKIVRFTSCRHFHVADWRALERLAA